MTRPNAVWHTISDYAFRARLDLPYEQAVESVTGALKEEGFGVLTEIDVKATLKQKLDADFRKYIILGACNPRLAHQALNTELEIGLLLPCNVIVYEEDGGSVQNGVLPSRRSASAVVSIVDPLSMLGVVENPELDPVANEARTRLQRVIDVLGG